MDHPIVMTPIDRAHELEDIEAHKLRGESTRVLLEHLEKVAIGILENQVKLPLSPKRFFYEDDIEVF